jgi:hypothetical protein
MNYKNIPKKYDFLFKGRLYDTDTMKDEYRRERINRLEFNKCERCGYDLLNPESYRARNGSSERFPCQGYVSYYHRHKKILCDKCVDGLNGQPWR